MSRRQPGRITFHNCLPRVAFSTSRLLVMGADDKVNDARANQKRTFSSARLLPRAALKNYVLPLSPPHLQASLPQTTCTRLFSAVPSGRPLASSSSSSSAFPASPYVNDDNVLLEMDEDYPPFDQEYPQQHYPRSTPLDRPSSKHSHTSTSTRPKASSSSVAAEATPTTRDDSKIPDAAVPHVDHHQQPAQENVWYADYLAQLEQRAKTAPDHYPALEWAQHFGRRSDEYEQRLQSLVKLQPGDEGYFPVDHIHVPRVSIVRTREQARKVLERLRQADPARTIHACDTEVMDIDLKEVGPVGNGYVTCVSIYSGPDFDYGLGEPPGSVLWIDNLDDACGVLQEFKEWFEDERHLKVWHNYGFDRHVMWNEGINVKGFGGDTMHMARLQDTSRGYDGSGNGYSLESLTFELVGRRKRPMKEIFGVKRLRKDGSAGSLIDIPPIEVMQRDPKYRARWISYSAFDAEGTWLLHEKLKELLQQVNWHIDENKKMYTLYDYYWLHMRPFGEVLTDMERRGIRVDARDYLSKVEQQAREDRAHHVKVFRSWAATKIGADGWALNPASSLQLCTFLFGGAPNRKTGVETERVREFKVPREEIPDEALEAYRLRDEAAAQSLSNGTLFVNVVVGLVTVEEWHGFA